MFVNFYVILCLSLVYVSANDFLITYKNKEGVFTINSRVLSEFSEETNATIEYVEENGYVYLAGQYSRALDRMDQYYAPIDGSYRSYPTDYATDTNKTMFLIDSGVNTLHEDFKDSKITLHETDFVDGSDTTDDHGHGTFIASMLVGKEVGVVKEAHLISIRVLGSSGRTRISTVIEGMDLVKDWLEEDISRQCVLILSLSSDKSEIFNDKVKQIKKLGCRVVVAAGNHRGDACNYSPSSSNAAITVGSIDIDDNMSRFSNRGKCIDFFAVGNDIRAAKADGGYTFKSGTSFSNVFAAATVLRCLGGSTKRFNNCIDRYTVHHAIKQLDSTTKNLFLKLV